MHLKRLFSVLIAAALIGCSLQSPIAALTPETPALPTSTPVPGMIGPNTYAENINPLTGLPVDDPTLLDRRPIVAKISNAPPLVRPQAGLNSADLVFEHYAEGGLTRFSAVFYSQIPERVGSVRSARLIDYELVPMYQALLVYSGASNGVNEKVAAGDFFERTYMGIMYGYPYYFRDEAIPVPHNLFANAAAISQLATEEGLNLRPDLHGMAFHPEVPANAAGPANMIDLRYVATSVQWVYDPATGQYLRASDGLGHYDALTMQQVTADNVVVLYAEHVQSTIVESEWQGNVSYGWEIKLWFEGGAVIFRDGQQYNVRWQRPTREDMISFYTLDGAPFPLRPGRTWIQVMPLPEQQNPLEEGMMVQ